jgi:hypothetical protein
VAPVAFARARSLATTLADFCAVSKLVGQPFQAGKHVIAVIRGHDGSNMRCFL